jgi:ABC-2 type transport system permease protein
MKVLAYIFKDLRLYKKDILSNLVSLLIFPIALSFFYGLMQEKAFEGSSRINKFSLSIEDKDNSETSRIISEIFKDKSLQDMIEVKDSDEDIKIVIPSGFQKNLQNGEKTTLSINQVKKDTMIQAHIVEGFLTSFAQNASIANGVNRNVYSSNLSDFEKQRLAASLGAKLNETFKSSAIKADTVAMSNRLNAFEYYSIAMLTFISVLTIVAFSTEFIKERSEGTLKRIYTTSINGSQLFIGRVGAAFIVSLLSNICYVLFFRFIGKGFSGNILLLTGAVIINSLFISGMTGLIISLFKDEKSAKIILNTLMMVSVMLAGVFFPIDIIDNKFINIASKLTPNLWLADMYKKLALYNELPAMIPSLTVLSAVIVIAFAVGSYKMSRTFEY